MGTILEALEVSWASFWEVWGSLGLHFGSSGGLLGSILGALGALGLNYKPIFGIYVKLSIAPLRRDYVMKVNLSLDLIIIC